MHPTHTSLIIYVFRLHPLHSHAGMFDDPPTAVCFSRVQPVSFPLCRRLPTEHVSGHLQFKVELTSTGPDGTFFFFFRFVRCFSKCSLSQRLNTSGFPPCRRLSRLNHRLVVSERSTGDSVRRRRPATPPSWGGLLWTVSNRFSGLQQLVGSWCHGFAGERTVPSWSSGQKHWARWSIGSQNAPEVAH